MTKAGKGADDLPDVQAGRPDIDLTLNMVGVRNYRMPLSLPMPGGICHTVANATLGAELGAHARGTHMSRIAQCLQDLTEPFDWPVALGLMQKMRVELDSHCAALQLRFPLILPKAAPGSSPHSVSGQGCFASLAYDACVCAQLEGKTFRRYMEVDVPVMTVCPCSYAISSNGAAHSQRAKVAMRVAALGTRPMSLALLELIDIAENSASSAVYSVVKRPQEKQITEGAFARPMFVEDVARAAAEALGKVDDIGPDYEVEVASMESIHAHDAVAVYRTSGWRNDFLR